MITLPFQLTATFLILGGVGFFLTWISVRIAWPDDDKWYVAASALFAYASLAAFIGSALWWVWSV